MENTKENLVWRDEIQANLWKIEQEMENFKKTRVCPEKMANFRKISKKWKFLEKFEFGGRKYGQIKENCRQF